MGGKSKHLFNPCQAPKRQRLPAKIWELLRRNASFLDDVKKLQDLDAQARQESKEHSDIAIQYNKAIFENDAALIAQWQPRYNAVKDRPFRTSAAGLIERQQDMHPLAALALTWLVPEPLFFASCQRGGQVEQGDGLSPDLTHPSWIWRDSSVPQGATGDRTVRGPQISGNLEAWLNWRPGRALFDCGTPWNLLPNSFKSEFVRVWEEQYDRKDRKDAFEFEYIHPPSKAKSMSRDDLGKYLEFLDIVTRHRLFAISPAILTTKDVGQVFEKIQKQIKQGLPESREHIFGSEAAWRHYLAVVGAKLSLREYMGGAGYKKMNSAELTTLISNKRKNVRFGIKAVEALIALVFPTFEFKKAVLIQSAPPRDKKRRRKSSPTT